MVYFLPYSLKSRRPFSFGVLCPFLFTPPDSSKKPSNMAGTGPNLLVSRLPGQAIKQTFPRPIMIVKGHRNLKWKRIHAKPKRKSSHHPETPKSCRRRTTAVKSIQLIPKITTTPKHIVKIDERTMLLRECTTVPSSKEIISSKVIYSTRPVLPRVVK